MVRSPFSSFLFFFNDTATTEIYTLSLHDALPISWSRGRRPRLRARQHGQPARLSRMREGCFRAHSFGERRSSQDRKSTRLNSSHSQISYAVFCLKKKKKKTVTQKTYKVIKERDTT